MWWVQYVLLFVAGAGLSAAAYLDHARGVTALLGVFVWFVVGTASTAVVLWDGAGTRHVVTSTPIAWLAYANASVHAFVFLAALREELTDDDTDPISPDELAQQVDTGDLQQSFSRFNVPGSGDTK